MTNTKSPVNTTKVDLNKLKKNTATAVTSPAVETETSVPAAKPEPSNLQEAQEFQHYKSSRNSTRMITSEGKKIAFCNFELYTQDEDIIKYLDYEIGQNKLLGITKGLLVSKEERDPMAALKKQHIEEFLKVEAKKAADARLGKTTDMGRTKGASAAQIDPAHSGNVAR